MALELHECIIVWRYEPSRKPLRCDLCSHGVTHTCCPTIFYYYANPRHNTTLDYQPNIKSDIWPSIPLPGETGAPFEDPSTGVGAPCCTTAFTWPCMGEGATFLKAEADGASLIGVPYVGVLLCE